MLMDLSNTTIIFAVVLCFLAAPCLAMSMSRPHKLFVYGTLKRGFYNHEVYLKPAEQYGTANYLGLAQTCDRFALQVLGPRCIPAMSEGDQATEQHRVEGEVYEISGSVLQAMDILEGVAKGFYYRAKKPVRCRSNDSMLDCWVYLQHQKASAAEEQPTYPVYTAELHSAYVPPTTEPDTEILALLKPPPGD